MSNDIKTELNELGRVWFRKALPESELADLEAASEAADRPGKRLDWNDGFQNGLGRNSAMVQLVNSIMPNCRPVRLVAFNKSPNSNWSVPWHQDRIVAVAERHDVAGFVNWSQKSGTWHAEPPIDLLENMLFARIHFDRTDTSNGCLELALGTHKLGFIPSDQACEVAMNARLEECKAQRGDVLIIKALTLHRSLPSQSGRNRRTLRVDYANELLPAPLQWAVPLF